MGNAQAFNSDKIGFQVTAVSPNSPGEEAGLRVTEDFILTMNGQALPFIEAEKIMSTVKNSINRPVLLSVYNVKTAKCRDVVLTPSNNWPGEGLLGIKIRLNVYEAVHVDVNYNDVYTREEDEYEDVGVSTPKKATTPTGAGSSKKHFGAGDFEFSNIEESAPAPSSSTKTFLKRFSFTGGK